MPIPVPNIQLPQINVPAPPRRRSTGSQIFGMGIEAALQEAAARRNQERSLERIQVQADAQARAQEEVADYRRRMETSGLIERGAFLLPGEVSEDVREMVDPVSVPSEPGVPGQRVVYRRPDVAAAERTIGLRQPIRQGIGGRPVFPRGRTEEGEEVPFTRGDVLGADRPQGEAVGGRGAGGVDAGESIRDTASEQANFMAEITNAEEELRGLKNRLENLKDVFSSRPVILQNLQNMQDNIDDAIASGRGGTFAEFKKFDETIDEKVDFWLTEDRQFRTSGESESIVEVAMDLKSKWVQRPDDGGIGGEPAWPDLLLVARSQVQGIDSMSPSEQAKVRSIMDRYRLREEISPQAKVDGARDLVNQFLDPNDEISQRFFATSVLNRLPMDGNLPQDPTLRRAFEGEGFNTVTVRDRVDTAPLRPLAWAVALDQVNIDSEQELRNIDDRTGLPVDIQRVAELMSQFNPDFDRSAVSDPSSGSRLRSISGAGADGSGDDVDDLSGTGQPVDTAGQFGGADEDESVRASTGGFLRQIAQTQDTAAARRAATRLWTSRGSAVNFALLRAQELRQRAQAQGDSSLAEVAEGWESFADRLQRNPDLGGGVRFWDQFQSAIADSAAAMGIQLGGE